LVTVTVGTCGESFPCSWLPCGLPIYVFLLIYCPKDGMDMFPYESAHESLSHSVDPLPLDLRSSDSLAAPGSFARVSVFSSFRSHSRFRSRSHFRFRVSMFSSCPRLFGSTSSYSSLVQRIALIM